MPLVSGNQFYHFLARVCLCALSFLKSLNRAKELTVVGNLLPWKCWLGSHRFATWAHLGGRRKRERERERGTAVLQRLVDLWYWWGWGMPLRPTSDTACWAWLSVHLVSKLAMPWVHLSSNRHVEIRCCMFFHGFRCLVYSMPDRARQRAIIETLIIMSLHF